MSLIMTSAHQLAGRGTGGVCGAVHILVVAPVQD